MDFGILPPEINSGRMYAGPGPGPMLAAAAAWDGLAAELESTAHSYESVISELANGWVGPSATAMTSAVGPYAAWMHHTAAQVEHTAAQAKFAAAAYEAAFAMTVPPPVVAANRSQLLVLIATNFFGQNTPAIAATETHYAEMWAQDAAAMYGYADGSATASMLAPFNQPPPTANPGGLGHQVAAAAANTAGTSATTSQSALSQLISALPSLASPAAGGGASHGATIAVHIAVIVAETLADLIGSFAIDPAASFGIDGAGVYIGHLFGHGGAALDIPHHLAGVASGARPVSAGMGRAAPIAGLSVPPSWTAAAPGVRPAAAAQPVAGTGDDSKVSVDHMAMTGLAGLAGAAGLGRGQKPPETTGRQRVKPQQKPTNVPDPEIVTELRELIDLNYAGILTDTEYAEQKGRLLRPGGVR